MMQQQLVFLSRAARGDLISQEILEALEEFGEATCRPDRWDDKFWQDENMAELGWAFESQVITNPVLRI